MKDLDYYMQLPYPIQVEELPAEWDGGWLAWIPMLAGKATGAYGETREEALKELEEIKRLLLEDRL